MLEFAQDFRYLKTGTYFTLCFSVLVIYVDFSVCADT